MTGLAARLASAQERFVRVMAAETRDKAGRVDPNKLQAFMADNANMLERFPGLQDDLSDIASAERLFRETDAATAHASKAIRNKATFSRLTVFDIAAACLDRKAGSGDRAKLRFLEDEAKRDALRRECLIGALAVDVCEELFDEALRDGFDDDVEVMLETRRRAREPEALERLRQRFQRALN